MLHGDIGLLTLIPSKMWRALLSVGTVIYHEEAEVGVAEHRDWDNHKRAETINAASFTTPPLPYNMILRLTLGLGKSLATIIHIKYNTESMEHSQSSSG